MVGVGLGQIIPPGRAPVAETELVETAFNEHRLGLARRRVLIAVTMMLSLRFDQ